MESGEEKGLSDAADRGTTCQHGLYRLDLPVVSAPQLLGILMGRA